MKVILVMVLFLFLTACKENTTASSSVPTPPPTDSSGEGNGGEENIDEGDFIEISTAKQLSEIRNDLTKSYKLVNDITLPPVSGTKGCAPELEESIQDYCTAGWEPIGQIDPNNAHIGDNEELPAHPTLPTPFTGKFDGNNFVIKNLFINRSTEVYYVAGLFGYVKGGAISKVGLENVDIKITSNTSATRWAVGGLIGKNEEGSIISSYTKGRVVGSGLDTDDGYSIQTGGLVGENFGGTIKSSHSTANVSSVGSYDSWIYTGGLVGLNRYKGIVESSYATGSINATNGWDPALVGGLVGMNDGSTIKSSYATGNISVGSIGSGAGRFQIGGLAGVNCYEATITSSYATGNVIGNDGYSIEAGGVSGGNCHSSLISSSYARGNIAVVNGLHTYVGGLSSGNWNSTITSSYATGNFSGWVVYGGGLIGQNIGGVITSSYRNSDFTFTNITIMEPAGTPIRAGETMTGETWADTSIWKSNVAFPELAWQN